MMKFRADNATWIQTGKNAAEKGKNAEAIYALCVLMTPLFAALEVIVENQFELYRTITSSGPAAASGAAAAAAPNGRKP